MDKRKIVVACDHAGYELKEFLKQHHLFEQIAWEDLGTDSPDSVDYPDFAHPLANAIENEAGTLGLLICGSANGVAMTANKHQGVRAAIAWDVPLAELARQHNDANVLALPARFISQELAADILQAFIETPFEGGRHARRVNKICN